MANFIKKAKNYSILVQKLLVIRLVKMRKSFQFQWLKFQEITLKVVLDQIC